MPTKASLVEFEPGSIDIGVACSPTQRSIWWGPVLAYAIQWAQAGLKLRSVPCPGRALTDVARCMVVAEFMAGTSEWLFWIDDDTVPPVTALPRLLALNRPFVAGLYFMKQPEENPLAYKRNDAGFYCPIEDWKAGTLIEVDAVGMGCTLIHRSVFLKIVEEHVLLSDSRGSLRPVHKSEIYPKRRVPKWMRGERRMFVGEGDEMSLC